MNFQTKCQIQRLALNAIKQKHWTISLKKEVNGANSVEMHMKEKEEEKKEIIKTKLREKDTLKKSKNWKTLL